MLRIVAAAVLIPIFVVIALVIEMRVEVLLNPRAYEPDRGTGFMYVVFAWILVYSWLYAMAVGLAVTRCFRITKWRHLFLAAALLALPPWLVELYQEYDPLEGNLAHAASMTGALIGWPFAVALFIAIMCMASNKSLERTRGG